MDQELLTLLDQRLARASEHARGRAVETRRRFDVAAEGLRRPIRLVAEGHAALARPLDEHPREQDAAHREILSAVKLSDAELGRRVTPLEAVSADLEGRLARLKARR
jgi:hypothetical protein